MIAGKFVEYLGVFSGTYLLGSLIFSSLASFAIVYFRGKEIKPVQSFAFIFATIVSYPIMSFISLPFTVFYHIDNIYMQWIKSCKSKEGRF